MRKHNISKVFKCMRKNIKENKINKVKKKINLLVMIINFRSINKIRNI